MQQYCKASLIGNVTNKYYRNSTVLTTKVTNENKNKTIQTFRKNIMHKLQTADVNLHGVVLKVTQKLNARNVVGKCMMKWFIVKCTKTKRSDRN